MRTQNSSVSSGLQTKVSSWDPIQMSDFLSNVLCGSLRNQSFVSSVSVRWETRQSLDIAVGFGCACRTTSSELEL